MAVDLDHMPHIVPICRISNAQIISHARKAVIDAYGEHKIAPECPFHEESPLHQVWQAEYLAHSISLAYAKALIGQ